MGEGHALWDCSASKVEITILTSLSSPADTAWWGWENIHVHKWFLLTLICSSKPFLSSSARTALIQNSFFSTDNTTWDFLTSISNPICSSDTVSKYYFEIQNRPCCYLLNPILGLPWTTPNFTNRVFDNLGLPDSWLSCLGTLPPHTSVPSTLMHATFPNTQWHSIPSSSVPVLLPMFTLLVYLAPQHPLFNWFIFIFISSH